MRMRAGANDTDKQLGKGSPSDTNAESDAETLPQQSRKADPPNPQSGEKQNSCALDRHALQKKASTSGPFTATTIPPPKFGFDRREAGEVEIKSLENRAFDRGAICDVHFFHAIGRARFSLHLETEIGMLLER
jgi:hypothetical protein